MKIKAKLNLEFEFEVQKKSKKKKNNKKSSFFENVYDLGCFRNFINLNRLTCYLGY